VKQRSKNMMTYTQLPFQYLSSNNSFKLTSFAGLPLYMELANKCGLWSEIIKRLHSKVRGWTDLQIVMSLIMLNLAGGDCVDDIERLESDEGLSTILLKIETHGMKHRERRNYEKRWRKSKQRAFPSTAVIHRYLLQFHNEPEEQNRSIKTAFIPAPNKLMQKLLSINSALIDYSQQNNPHEIATLDQDATLSTTHKNTALYCYKKYKAYQPFNTYWAEQGLLVHSEFRDGNVPAGFEQLRLLEESLQQLPAGVKKAYLRSDSAGYQEKLLRYCAEGKDERFGIIEFAVAAKISQGFKRAVLEVNSDKWQPIYKGEGDQKIKTEQGWTEVCYVPDWAIKRKDAPNYRYIAIRERMNKQLQLDGLELAESAQPIQRELPFQTIQLDQSEYKLFSIVTNRTLPGNELINWHRARCGYSEKVHSVEKGDLTGGQFPSNKFGANAAWWQVMILAYNLNRVMQILVLPESLKNKRLKGLRFHITS